MKKRLASLKGSGTGAATSLASLRRPVPDELRGGLMIRSRRNTSALRWWEVALFAAFAIAYFVAMVWLLVDGVSR